MFLIIFVITSTFLLLVHGPRRTPGEEDTLNSDLHRSHQGNQAPEPRAKALLDGSSSPQGAAPGAGAARAAEVGESGRTSLFQN